MSNVSAISTTTTTPSRHQLWQLGYVEQIPVIPHTVNMRAAGKRPGRIVDGRWNGTGAVRLDATPELLAKWSEMGAATGLRCDKGLVALDVDSLNPEWVSKITRAAEKVLGLGPKRIGRPPKALFLYATDDEIKYRNIKFDDGTDKGGLVELLAGDAKWFVASGVHPTTKEPYYWPEGLCPRDELIVLSADKIAEFMDRLEENLPKAKRSGSSVDRTNVVQEALKAPDLELAEDAVRAIIDAGGLPDKGYHPWYNFSVALRGAFQDEFDWGCDLFCELSDLFEGEPEEDAARVYRSTKPPFGFGWGYIRSMALRMGWGRAPEAFISREELALAVYEAETSAPEPVAATPDQGIKWIRPREWKGKTPPPREWEVENWVPKGEVTLLYGDGGIGKTLLAHQYATCAAAGIDWLGQPTRKAKVMCFFCEDSEDELLRRQIDINKSLMLDFDDTDENLRIASRKYMDNLLVVWDRNTGAMKHQAVWEQLRNDAVAFGADVIVVDTIADTYSGSEIDRVQVNTFVKSCLGRLAEEIGGSVIALGHPSMAGKASGSGTSGSTAWSNAARSRLFLRYPKGVEKGNIRELEGMKANYTAKGALLKLRWEAGSFVKVASSLPGPAEIGQISFRGSEGDGVTAAHLGVPAGSIEAVAIDAVLGAVRANSDTQMSLAANSPHYAPKVLKRREPALLEALSDAETEAAVLRLEAAGVLFVDTVGKNAHRKPVKGLRIRDNLSSVEPDSDGVFS